MSDPLRNRALRSLMRGRGDAGPYHRRFSPSYEADLLMWATTLADEDILELRNIGPTMLRWIRQHQESLPVTECRHNRITVYFEEKDGAGRMWACGECKLRFYPACPVCVDVGHRNEAHIDQSTANDDQVSRWLREGYDAARREEEK